MKIIKILFYSIIGLILSSTILWGGLYLYGTLILHGHGSLFDERPDYANIFFFTWVFISIIFILISIYLATRTKTIKINGHE